MAKSFKTVAVFVISLLLVSVLAATPGSDLSQCAFQPDFIPDAALECTKNVPISCRGTTVCYKYPDTLSVLPCVLGVYGFSGLIKLNKCGDQTQYSWKPGNVVCVEEDQLRKFFVCFAK